MTPALWLRIDDRLIHGQVVAAWVPHLKASRIVVVSDAAAADETQGLLMRLAVPDDVELEVLTLAQAGARARELADGGGRVLVLVPSPREALALIEAGLKVLSVNVGGLHYSIGKIQIGRAIFLASEDRSALKAIAARGVELDARAVPAEKGIPLLQLIEEGA